MELHVTEQAEARLNELARRTHRDQAELLEEAIDHLLAYNDWLERKVKDSQAAGERGQVVPDVEVCAWMERRERS